MADSLNFTVPARTTTHFVVATDREPGDVRLPLHRRLIEPFATAVAERLGTPQLTITGHSAAESPWNLDQVAGEEEDHETEARVRKAAHHISVIAALPVTDQPFGSQVARAVTRAIADATGGVPVDVDTGHVFSYQSPAEERAGFVLADDWIGAWLPSYRDDGRCTADENEVDGCACVELTTRGLRRFGLPELRITGVACPHDLAALNVLRGTAQYLLSTEPRPGTRSLPRGLAIASDDFAAYWGVDQPMWTDGPIPIGLDVLDPRLLEVGPPQDYDGSINDWLWDELPPVMYELLSCDPDPEPTLLTHHLA